jgi:hypothetical protein
MIDVVQDAEGVRMALEEIFEEDFVRSRIDHESAGADEQTRERMAFQIPPRTLSPGYYDFGLHRIRGQRPGRLRSSRAAGARPGAQRF